MIQNLRKMRNILKNSKFILDILKGGQVLKTF